jgi:hypothetical protein
MQYTPPFAVVENGAPPSFQTARFGLGINQVRGFRYDFGVKTMRMTPGAPSSRSLGAVHDGHERSEFGRMHASRQPNQR